MDEDVESSDTSNILYDLTIQTEWQLDPEVVFRSPKEKTQLPFTSRLTSSASRSAWTFLRTVGVPVRSGSPCSLSPALVKLVNSQAAWQFDVSQDGRQVVLLQDQSLEIRTSRDDFAGPFSRWSVTKDPQPQWRALAWSLLGDMLACSNSLGAVTLYDLMGAPVCQIPSSQTVKPNVPTDLSHAVCGLIFKQHSQTADKPWPTELLVINYQGTLKNYAISDNGTFTLRHSFSFGSHYSRGVGAVVYSPTHSLLFVGGEAEPISHWDGDTPTAAQLGVTAWRLLSDQPHYKQVTDYETDIRLARRHRKLLKKLRHLYSWNADQQQDGIYKLSLSPSGHLLAAVHHSGALTLLDVPSLRIRSSWQQDQQPLYNEVNQAIAENPKKSKVYKEQLTAFYLTDVNWWSDQEVILARGTGAVSVACVDSLRNLLGPSPEWFEGGAPRVSMAHSGGFLGLECESQYSPLKRQRSDSEVYEDSDSDLDTTIVSRSTKYMRQALYYVTDSEKFQPPRKRPKLVTKTYRLVCLKSTTPEELYHRKIESEEYGEALALARAYSLDCDLVYQRQWRHTPVSVASIQDYLSKISKRSWVLHECLQRVPENIDAMRELLQYGLRGTDLEALVAIEKGEDGGRFILCDRYDVYEDSIDPFNPEAVEEANQRQKDYVQNLLSQIDVNRLTLQQLELCRARHRLLQYLDRLATYEEILGGAHYAPDRYDPKTFENFRSANIVELTVDYARGCDWQAVDTLLSYHGNELLPHRLAILFNFPETCAPRDYMVLLPEVERGADSVVAWQQHKWTEPDWCQQEEYRQVLFPGLADLGAFLYEEQPELEKFRGEPLTVAMVTEWYGYKAREIERLSRQVDHSLELVTIACQDKHVQGLERLQDDLVTMDTLVYECRIDDKLTFEDFLELSNIERLRKHMEMSSPEMYAKSIRRWMVPFLRRCDKHQPGSFNTLICEYLVDLAKTDLSLCLKVFESCRADQPQPVIGDEYLVMSMALKCIYTCESADQLSNAYGILECLPQRGFGMVTEQSTRLHNQVDELECHLSAAEILEKHDSPQTIAIVRDTQHEEEAAKNLFIKLTRKATNKSAGLPEKEWKKLLVDVLFLRDKVFQCVSATDCYQIFVESLLCSGCLSTLAVAGRLMERSAAVGAEPDYTLPAREEDDILRTVAYPAALSLVLSVAHEYFDSSSTLTDHTMQLARACLGLIEDCPQSVQEELDLIDSLTLLDGFGVNILPLQVRMCQNRLELIQRAIDAKAFTYKNSQRLLKLANLLRIPGDSKVERDGVVLQLIAQAALKVRDIGVAYHTCQRLMDLGFSGVWTECKQLAELEEFHNIQGKAELLSFAITYCSSDMIEPILRAKCLLDTQILYEKVHTTLADRDSQSPPETPFSARGAIRQTREILSSTNRATRQVLSSVGNKDWWKKTLRSLHPLSRERQGETEDGNKVFSRQGCHPFYQSLIPNPYCSKAEADYERMRGARPDVGGLDFSESLLHTGRLEERLSESATSHHTTQVLQQLAQDSITRDTSLGLAYLLALSQPLDAETVFQSSPRTAVSLELAVYYYALQIERLLDQSTPASLKSVYHYAPRRLVQKVQRSLRQASAKRTAGQTDGLAERLKHYSELLADYRQVEVLERLDRGIDVGRFTVDADYKRETILGLAMTSEPEVYQITVTLATRYKLPLWDVYMAHLEFLFDSGLPTEELSAAIYGLAILPTLQAESTAFQRRLATAVYPGIPGTDHDRLALYYSLMEPCPSTDRITPATHLKLLKKVKHAAPGLDYVKLTDGRHDPLDILRPVLTADNITMLAKLAAKLPNQSGGFLQPSIVYCGWAIHTFWQSGRKAVSDSTDWLHRYEACGEYAQKLSADDFVKFVTEITFVADAVTELPVDVRRQITRRALKYCKQQQSTNRKRKLDNPLEVQSWDEAVTSLQQSLEHLDKLSHDVIQKLRQAGDLQATYAQDFDLSRSEPAKLESLYLRMVLDGQTPDDVQQLIDVATVGAWTAKTAYTEAVQRVTQAVRMEPESDPLLRDQNALTTLRTVVSQVAAHQQRGGHAVTSEDMMTLLRPFCADATVAIDKRLEILTILEQCFSLEDADLTLLTLYRTEAVVSTAWPHRQTLEESIHSDATRTQLFGELLAESSELAQFQALTSLLNVWPPLGAVHDSSEAPASQPWCRLLSHLVTQCGESASGQVVDLMRALQQTSPLSPTCLRSLCDVLVSHQMAVVAVKCLLLTEDDTLHSEAVSLLQKQQLVPEDGEELYSLLLQRHLAAAVVDTVHYAGLVEQLLGSQGGPETPYHLDVATVAGQLQTAGREVEAVSLLAAHRGLHPALRTWDTALGLIGRWLHR